MPIWRENPVKWDKTNIEIKSLFLKFKDSIENVKRILMKVWKYERQIHKGLKLRMHKKFTQINKKTTTTQQKHKQKSRTYEELVYEDMSTSSVIQENEKYMISHLSYWQKLKWLMIPNVSEDIGYWNSNTLLLWCFNSKAIFTLEKHPHMFNYNNTYSSNVFKSVWSKYTLMGKWINCDYIYTMKYYIAVRMNELKIHLSLWRHVTSNYIK